MLTKPELIPTREYAQDSMYYEHIHHQMERLSCTANLLHERSFKGKEEYERYKYSTTETLKRQLASSIVNNIVVHTISSTTHPYDSIRAEIGIVRLDTNG